MPGLGGLCRANTGLKYSYSWTNVNSPKVVERSGRGRMRQACAKRLFWGNRWITVVKSQFHSSRVAENEDRHDPGVSVVGYSLRPLPFFGFKTPARRGGHHEIVFLVFLDRTAEGFLDL
jgi:hypothetical protein